MTHLGKKDMQDEIVFITRNQKGNFHLCLCNNLHTPIKM